MLHHVHPIVRVLGCEVHVDHIRQVSGALLRGAAEGGRGDGAGLRLDGAVVLALDGLGRGGPVHDGGGDLLGTVGAGAGAGGVHVGVVGVTHELGVPAADVRGGVLDVGAGTALEGGLALVGLHHGFVGGGGDVARVGGESVLHHYRGPVHEKSAV